MTPKYTGLTLAVILLSFAVQPARGSDEFDRLDGTGKSRKRVDVIEWEGNLEIHVYPKGSLVGLALKIDDSTGKKVMVLGYRFDNAPRDQLVRRAILSVPLREPLNVYRDSSPGDYDKLIITNHVLVDGLVKFQTDQTLKAMYPDGHPALGDDSKSETSERRSPAGDRGSIREEDFNRSGPSDGYVDEAGTIRPYTW